MNDDQDRGRIYGSYVFDGKELAVVESQDGWRVNHDGKEVEHANIDHALAGAVRRSPGLMLGLVRQILNSAPGSDLGS